MILDSTAAHEPFSTLDRVGPIWKDFAAYRKNQNLRVSDPTTQQASMTEKPRIPPIVARLTAQISDSGPTTNHEIPIVIRLLKPH